MQTTKHFDLDAGVLCLDFVNTADGDLRGEWSEWLEHAADLVAWGEQSGVITSEQAKHLLTVVEQNPRAAAGILERARELRMTIYYIFSAVADERAPDSDDLDVLNAALSRALPHLEVAVTPEGFEWRWGGPGDDLERVLWPVIRSAADLLTSDDLDRVRECDGHDCSWMFLDMSRNRSRRWCDMQTCGNRAKARRHYERTKGEG